MASQSLAFQLAQGAACCSTAANHINHITLALHPAQHSTTLPWTSLPHASLCNRPHCRVLPPSTKPCVSCSWFEPRASVALDGGTAQRSVRWRYVFRRAEWRLTRKWQKSNPKVGVQRSVAVSWVLSWGATLKKEIKIQEPGPIQFLRLGSCVAKTWSHRMAKIKMTVTCPPPP